MKKIWKFLKKLFILLIITIFMIIIGILAFTWIYHDELINYAKNHIKDYFETDIEIEKLDFSLFKKFPDATIILNNVLIKSSNTFNKKDFKQITDTLLFAQEILLQFDLFKILKKNYELQAIQLNKANVWLLFDKKGNHNFSILKQTNDTTSVCIKLKQLKFLDFKLNLYQAAKDIHTFISTNHFKLSGDFYKEKYFIRSQGQLNIHQLQMQGVNYLKNGKAQLKATLWVNNQQISLKSGTLSIGDIKLGLSGNYRLEENTDEIQLEMIGHKISMEELIKSLPENIISNIENLDAKGFADIKAEIKGGISNNINPRIKINFSISDGSIRNKENNAELQHLTLSGKFDNGLSQNINSSSLVIDTFYTVLNDSSLGGKFSMVNFNQPMIKLRIKGGINLEKLKSLLELDTFETLSGFVSVNLNYTGKIRNLSKITVTDYQLAQVKGMVSISNFAMKMINSSYTIENLNGIYRIHNNDVQTDKTTLIINKTPILFSGTLQNFIAYLMLDNQKINALLNINIPELDWNNWNNPSEKHANIAIPENIKLNADIAIDEFRINKLNIKKMISSVQVSYPVISFSGTTFQTNEGTVSCNLKIIADNENKLTLQGSGALQQLNIKKVFQTFDNFDQSFIQDKNIQGKLTANISMLQLRWDEKQNIIEKDILLDANFLITNGQLIDFEPMYSLADYISLSELRQVKFSDLKNDIFIQNRKILIPNMEIKCNAFNIEVSGEHTFDNEIEYRIKLLLREWLANKARKNKKENEEFGIEENDGLGSTALYLVIKGTTDKYKITYDSKKMKDQVKESLKKEKQEIKAILNQEFGLFKKDSLNLKQQNKRQEELKKPKFKIEWDEDNPEKDRSE